MNRDNSSARDFLADSSLQLRKEELKADLEKLFSKFKDISTAYHALKQKTGLERAALYRYRKGLRFPENIETIKEIYSCISGSSEIAQILQAMPPATQQYVKQKIMSEEALNKQMRKDFSKELERNSAFRYIYWRVREGGTVMENNIVHEFGRLGTQTIKQMLSLGVISELSPGCYTNGDIESIIISGNALRESLGDVVRDFVPTIKEGANYLGMMCGGVTTEDYDKVRRLLSDTYQEVRKIILSSPRVEKIISAGVVADTTNDEVVTKTIGDNVLKI